jgi:S-adenosylmethionine:tRNA ribosyltransferase-isomerase
MQLTDFDYDLPEELIAKYPLAERSASRLLVVDHGAISHHSFKDLPDLLRPTDLLVFNNTKVVPARLFAQKLTGGKVEILMERMVAPTEILAHCRASHLKPGHELIINDEIKFEVLHHEQGLYHLKLISAHKLMDVFNQHGHMPLPPYMKREDELADKERYQTIYAAPEGSVAAPTAGLHFDARVFERLATKGIEHVFVTLHVGAGTFQPVKAENITEHQMHSEVYEVSIEAAQKINAAKKAGRRVIAVGTTSVRTLESVACNHEVIAGFGSTEIFIYPGYDFKVVDGMITNFHLPKSSLLMLVSAFAGLEVIKEAYRIAILERYRFFSYGDAMLLL